MTDGSWLGIELRRHAASAVLAWPDGTAQVLPVDREPTGHPGSRGGEAPGPADDPAALDQLFRQVAREAATAAGRLPDAVTVVIPAPWGARQLPAVRRAAAAAGLGAIEVMPAAVAVGWHLLAGGVVLEPGAEVLVCTVDGGCAATVLRRVAEGFEVMSSVNDQTVAADMPAPGLPDAPAGDGLVREVTRRAMAGAQLIPGLIDLVCAVGPDADPAVGADLEAVCGVTPMLVAEPELAGALGALQRGPLTVRRSASTAGREWWDLIAVVLPAVWSVALFAQFMAGSERYGVREKVYASGMLLAPWGVLAVAAVFGLVALTGGLVLVGSARHSDDGDAAMPRWVHHRLQALAVVGGAAGGVGLAAMYAVFAASYFDLDLGPLLRWSVLPILPAVVAILGVAVMVWRRPDPPGGSWSSWLRFPPFAVLAAGFGTLCIGFDLTGQPWLIGPLVWWLEHVAPMSQPSIVGPIGRFGGMCVGGAVGMLIARRPLPRLLLGVPLALLVGATLTWRVTGAVLAGFVLVVAAWWASRTVWLVLRPLLMRTPTPAAHASDPLTPSPPPIATPHPQPGSEAPSDAPAGAGWHEARS